jgi:hypothetical protein
VRRKALRLIRDNGDLAFFRAHELAWRAQGREDRAQAEFWETFAREVSRQIQRNAILTSIMTPSPGLPPAPSTAPEAAVDADAPLPAGNTEAVHTAEICQLPVRRLRRTDARRTAAGLRHD